MTDLASAAVDDFLSRHEPDLLALVRDLIEIDSQTPPYADESRVVQFLAETMAQRGIAEQQILSPTPGRPTLLGTVRGKGGGRNLMLVGHTDTKPIGDARDQWRSDPLEARIEGGLLYGLGAADMKAALAAMVFAAAAIAETISPLAGDLTLGFFADEEAGANHGARAVAPLLGGIDAALIGEPSGWTKDWQGIHLVSRGLCGFRIVVHGTQTHSSLSDALPSVNASVKAAELLTSMTDELSIPFQRHPLGGGRPTLIPGVLVSGGVGFGVVPGRAEFACELRTLPGMTLSQVENAIGSWLGDRMLRDADLRAELVMEPGLTWLPPSEIFAEHPLVSAVADAASAVLPAVPPLSVFPGGTDAPWLTQAGIPTIASFGPGLLTTAHGPNEWVRVTAILEAARIYARAAVNYIGLAD